MPGLINLHYLGGIITMNLHYLDLTPLQFWRAGAPQSVMLGEVRGSVRHTTPLQAALGGHPHRLANIRAACSGPLLLYWARFCPPPLRGGKAGTQRAHLLIQQLSPDEIFNLISKVPSVYMLTLLGSRN